MTANVLGTISLLISIMSILASCDKAKELMVGDTVEVSPLFGGNGGVTFGAQCKPGQLVTGIQKSARTSRGCAWLLAVPVCACYDCFDFSPICGTATYNLDNNMTKHEVNLANEPLQKISSLEYSAVQTCPDNQVVVGVQLRKDMYVDGLSLLCAPLYITREESVSLLIGTPTPLKYETLYADGTGGSPVEFRCPNGSATNILGGKSEAFLDSLYLSCASVSP